MNFISIRTKYISGICCLILLVFISLLAYMRLQLVRQIDNQLQKRAVSIARNIAISAVKPIITENTIALQLLINETRQHEEDISYIYIVKRNGELLAHTFNNAFPDDLLKTDHLFVNSQKTPLHIRVENEEMVDATAPIQKGDFGRVHVGISEKFILSEINTILLQGVPIIALILLFGVIGAGWFAARITRPLSLLTASVRKVGQGEFEGELDITGNDEFGELACAYNTMVRQLKELTSKQLKTEDELRLQADMLEQEVAVRQVAQEDLAVKQHQLEALNRILEERVENAVDELRLKDKIMLLQGRQAAMGEMINNIAHQWRQPINNLGLIVQNIKADYDGGRLTAEELTEYVDKAFSTIRFMSHTINDFSSFFSPDRMKTRFSPFEGLKKVITMLEATLSLKNIVLQVEQQDDVTVEGFSNEYNQVLLNLLNNAKDILVERGVEGARINVSVARENGQAVVKIRDNAGGIPEEIIGKVFEPYFTTKDQGKGSGIGLYMSRMIIKEHFKGSISAANRNGGAEFTICTPCVGTIE